VPSICILCKNLVSRFLHIANINVLAEYKKLNNGAGNLSRYGLGQEMWKSGAAMAAPLSTTRHSFAFFLLCGAK